MPTRSSRPRKRGHPLSALIVALLLALAALLPAPAARAQSPESPPPAVIYLFWSDTCSHCAKARRFLEDVTASDSRLQLRSHEVSASAETEQLFLRTVAAYGIEVPAVPLVLIGERAFVGYVDDGSTGAAMLSAALACYEAGCPDIVGFLARQLRSETTGPPVAADGLTGPPGTPGPPLPAMLDIPLIGSVSTGSLSLPVLTILLAAVDGFNPCAMWVLVVLLGLLLGMTDHVRMWILGGVFLLASAVVYFLFMAAWLNVLLILGALAWIRLAVGAIALAGGAWNLFEFFRNPAGSCRVRSPGQRSRLVERLKASVRQRSLVVAIVGIVAIAVAANLVELLCSAGIPAVFTQVLAMSALPAWQYYLYLLLYLAVFLLDDLAVFVVAMVSLQASGLTVRYARFSHLIGGTILLAVGALLMLRPDWLQFSAAN